ncbi:MAG: hypothetical protein ACOCQD_01850 [archaeon]
MKKILLILFVSILVIGSVGYADKDNVKPELIGAPFSATPGESVPINVEFNNVGEEGEHVSVETCIFPDKWEGTAFNILNIGEFDIFANPGCCSKNEFCETVDVALDSGDTETYVFNPKMPTEDSYDHCSDLGSAWDDSFTVSVGVYDQCGEGYGQYKVKQNIEVKEEEININTKPAENIGEDSATLKADLTNLGGCDEVDVWFEYKSGSNWKTTNTERRGGWSSGTGTVSKDVTGLDEDTTYDFRAVSDPVSPCESSSDTGNTETFTTKSGDTCEDECSNDGDVQCVGESGRKECGDWDGDGCLEWENKEDCDYLCQDGECIESNCYILDDNECIEEPCPNSCDRMSDCFTNLHECNEAKTNGEFDIIEWIQDNLGIVILIAVILMGIGLFYKRGD